MATEQPTTERVQFLLTKVTEPRDREVLMRVQAELTSGARHNEGDVNKYADLWHTHGDKDAPKVDYGTSVRPPQAAPAAQTQRPKESNPPDPYTHEVKPQPDKQLDDKDKHAGPQDKSSPKR